MDLGIYYIGYVTKKPEYGISDVNTLYLIINRIDGFIEEINGGKYLNIADTQRNSEALKNIERYGVELDLYMTKII